MCVRLHILPSIANMLLWQRRGINNLVVSAPEKEDDYDVIGLTLLSMCSTVLHHLEDNSKSHKDIPGLGWRISGLTCSLRKCKGNGKVKYSELTAKIQFISL